ncbi:MAG: hypothetical protein RLZZ175_1964 [Bacteroidota bacterium]|jgi:hypothetical protein
MNKIVFFLSLICLVNTNSLFAQKNRVSVFYKTERSKASEGKGIGMDDIISNNYHLHLKGDKLILTFSNNSFLERLFNKKATKIIAKDTNSNEQLVLDVNNLKQQASDLAIAFTKTNFDIEKQKTRTKLAKEFTKILGGTYKDSINSISLIETLDEIDASDIAPKANTIISKNYNGNDATKYQVKINALLQKERITEEASAKDLSYFTDKPKRIIDEVIDKNIKYNWELVLDTIQYNTFYPSGWTVEIFGQKKRTFLFFIPGTEISYAKIKFDTINARIPDNLPLVDTALCSNDLLFAAFDNKFGTPFANAKCNNITKISCFPTYAPDSYQQTTFTINFPKSGVKDVGQNIKPVVENIHSRNYFLKHVRIHAYASVEGDSTQNANLAHARCMQIVHEFQKYTKDSISYDIETNENWSDFLRDMPNFPTASTWQYLDRKSLRTALNKEENKQWLEAFLEKHRYAQVEIFYAEHIPQNQVLDKIKLAYDSLVNNFEKHPLESEMKIAGMRNFLIHQYRHKVYSLDNVTPFFEFRTPRLDIVNSFQQFPLYKKGASTIKLPFDSIVVNALNASVKLYDITTHGLTPKDRDNAGGENSPAFVLKTFQTQLLRFCVKSIQEGKMDKAILSKWKFPAQEEFHFFALKSIVQNVNEENSIGHVQKPYAEKIYKLKDSTISIPLYDYALKPCGMKIVCKDSPYYTKVKTDITKNISNEKYDKSISEIFWYFFIENQVVNYNFLDKKIYDEEFNPEKTLQYFDKLNAHLCPAKKEKLLLAIHKNIALYSIKTNNPTHVKSSLDKIIAYYEQKKQLMPTTLMDELIRFIVYFQPELGENNECFKYVTTFMKHAEGKENLFQTPLVNKLHYLSVRSDY